MAPERFLGYSNSFEGSYLLFERDGDAYRATAYGPNGKILLVDETTGREWWERLEWRHYLKGPTFFVEAEEPESSDWEYWFRRTLAPREKQWHYDINRWCSANARAEEFHVRIRAVIAALSKKPISERMQYVSKVNKYKNISREIIFADQKLSKSNLISQCKNLEIEVTRLSNINNTNVENGVIEKLRQDYDFIIFDEGGTINGLIDAIGCGMSRRIKPVPFKFPIVSILGAGYHHPSWRNNIHKIIDSIEKSTVSDLEIGWEYLLKRHSLRYLQNNAKFKKIKPASIEQMRIMFNTINKNQLIDLININLLASSYFYNGWPDISAIEKGKFIQFEVKKNDTLIESQIRLIPALKKIGFTIKIIKVDN